MVYAPEWDFVGHPELGPGVLWLWRYVGTGDPGRHVPSDSVVTPRLYGDQVRPDLDRLPALAEDGWALVGDVAVPAPLDLNWTVYAGDDCFQTVLVVAPDASPLGLDSRETWRVCDREGRAEAFRVPDSLRVGFATEADRQTYLRTLGERSPGAVR